MTSVIEITRMGVYEIVYIYSTAWPDTEVYVDR
jgi:hypothetical protein